MKLQELIYFAHGWHLAIADEPLILEHVEAWDYGPVIPPVYHAFKRFGRHAIDERAQRVFVNFKTEKVEFQDYALTDDEDIEAFLKRIWEVYGDFSSTRLSNMTHGPAGAWYQTYYELGGQSRRGMDIPDDLIKEEFLNRALLVPT